MVKYLNVLKWIGLIFLGIFMLCAIILPIVVFVNNFKDHTISSDISRWGQFGDYFGGMFNPVFSIANIIFLIYASIKVSKLDDKRALNEFRHLAYKDLVEFIDQVDFARYAFTDLSPMDSLKYTKDSLNTFYINNHFLFENGNILFKYNTDFVLNKLSILIIALEKEEERVHENIRIGISDAIDYEDKELLNLYNEFNVARVRLKVYLQMVIINK